MNKHENGDGRKGINDLVNQNKNLKEELQKMIEMAAEANFKIDHLSIQNECLMNNQTLDDK